ncbi:MAG: RNA polymerase-associated protein rapA [endosymbiont of Seepiophila jonesi]|uniref:RNA polymerase-associated protein rapA n=1 Tax=endosymbiont of Lamellibrachia luymesi TaxID=2200907 RepID=A0A370DTY1_9GAMM|nr:MAG: RNA polymerase-associated protein rapA [endosymbiont of Lamellibrachia luymesi]RDH93592.1 MAG: RNA polymerase-associated protein rapA [endosymbiont of Seepiophila jonesi]
MYKRSVFYRSMLAAMLLPGAALAEVEISGYLKNETAVFTKSGQRTGQAKTMLDTAEHNAGDLLKFENSARIFFNGDIGEESSWHGELNLIYDTEGVDDYKGHENYTQNDWFRELYLDTTAFDWDFRLGKQQVVWGTADGIKLLDIINPTDYRELNQNAMEDARIPIWMINAERNIGESGNIQFIVSQVEQNKIPGLNASGDPEQPFLMKGVDSISGGVNGFLNVTPRLAAVAQSFNNAAQAGMLTGGTPIPSGLVGFAGLSVDGFASNPDPIGAGAPGSILLNQIAQFGLSDPTVAIDPNGYFWVTNVTSVTGSAPSDVNWSVTETASAFEYMGNATFATFNSFAGAGMAGSSAGAVYERDYPDTADANFGTRYRGSTDGGLNFSFNYFYHYDANPFVDMSWRDAVTKETLTVQRAQSMDIGGGAMAPSPATDLTADQVPNSFAPDGSNSVSILLHNAAGEYYGAIDPTTFAANTNTNTVEMVMTERLNRIHSLGGSLDYALDTAALGSIVFRAEALYNKDEMQPVVDKRLLGIGDLTNSLRMQEADMFKYVLGADITVATNMLVSAQFIQFWNMDFIDDSRTCTTQAGNSYDCSTYTGEMATMHMSNGLYKAHEFKEFYSLFFSKPFGGSQEHRWNNIVMFEEDGGWWNRFDVEYSFTDEIIGAFEWNNYWGEENTTFGQFADSSNVQLGLKWIFE